MHSRHRMQQERNLNKSLYTMKAIKRIAEVILTIIGCLAFVLLTAEADTIGMQMLCTIGSVSIIYVCIKLIEIIDPEIFEEEV